MYIEIFHKLENGCEIQNVACSEIGVMLHLLLVNYEQEYNLHTQYNNEHLDHGTDIIKYLHYLGININDVFVIILILLLFQMLNI